MIAAPSRALRALVGALIVALVVTGCFPTGAPSTPARTPVTTGVTEELVPYYGQDVQWESCSDGAFDCGSVTVPRDYDDLAAGDLEIAVIRHRADDGKPVGSLLVNPGGPGASGIELVRDSLGTAVSQPLQRAYDVVGFDPRGVGDSTAVDCYDDARLDEFLFGIPDAERGTPEWESELERRNAEYAQACEANSDGILPYISTKNAARDMDVLRAVFGDEKLHYLGYSWGAYLGAIYADLFPDRVGRVVLDGPIDPSVPGTEVSIDQSVGFEESLDAFLADCLTRSDCPYGGSVENARADLEALLARVDARPLLAADGRELGADTLMTAIIAALYAQASWPYLRVALAALENGDPSVAFTLADLYWGRQQGQYVDNSAEAFNAYNCMDYPEGTASDDTAFEERLRTEAPLTYDYRLGPDVCAQWPYEPTGAREAVSAEGAAPLLVVGTTDDPATPYEWAVSLAEQLPAVLITRVGEGHLGYNRGNPCVNRAVEAYLVDGVVPEGDVRCE